MSPMKSGLVLALALAVSGGGHFLSAQRGFGGQGLGLYGAGPRLGENVAFALEFQGELDLSDDQVRSLQAPSGGNPEGGRSPGYGDRSDPGRDSGWRGECG